MDCYSARQEVHILSMTIWGVPAELGQVGLVVVEGASGRGVGVSLAYAQAVVVVADIELVLVEGEESQVQY